MSTLAPNEPTRKIGELAESSGVTVRTLHYYEEIGLLVPSARTDAGHRLYAAPEVERLYRICLLKQLGIPLDGSLSAGSEPTTEILDVLEDMSMLDTTVNRPISSLVYEDVEAAYQFLTEVFGLGPGELTRDPYGYREYGAHDSEGHLWSFMKMLKD